MSLRKLAVLILSLAAGLVVTITARAELLYAPDTCRSGYVWREAFPGDHVCVTPETRDQAAYDNSQADVRRELGQVYGPDTCRRGYVWREAFPGDLVCVTPETRDQAAYDNNQADARIDPEGAYGPYTCVQGYVWREARPEDLVCVTPEIRTQTAYDNSEADARREPEGGAYGPDTCIAGYVWREARPEDLVCVTPETRAQTAYDNSQAAARLASAAPESSQATTRPASPSPDDKSYRRPLWLQQRLDWCLTWGAGCGRPAALAFCQRKRFEDVVAFSAEVVGKSVPTRLIGSNEVCSGFANCTAFASIICTKPIPHNRVFANPEWKRTRLDVCLQWGTNCGKPAADAYCRTKRFSEAFAFAQDLVPGDVPTRVMGTDQICTGPGCRGFQQIICQ